MFSSAIVDVAIGVTFLYLVLSLIASAASELLESFLRYRATDLERGIRELLDPARDDKVPAASNPAPANNPAPTPRPSSGGLTQTFYEHPLMSGLFRGVYKRASRTLPSYIPSRTFALALMDIVLPATNGPAPNGGTSGALAALPSAGSFREAISTIPNPQVQRALLALTDAANDDANKVRENIEAWFNSSMDRVSGWYKRRTHWFLFGIGFAIAVLVGANSIDIVTKLATDRTMREFLVAQATEEVRTTSLSGQAPRANSASGTTANTGTPDPSDLSTSHAREQQLQDGLKTLTAAGVFPGPEWNRWCTPSRTASESATTRAQVQSPNCGLADWKWLIVLSSMGGCFITACAVSLGAPFWFDLLNKFMVIRSTVKPKEKSPDEKSKA